MKICYEAHASETIVFAAEELGAYLERMLKDGLEDFVIHLMKDDISFSEGANDSYRIQVDEKGGNIVGNNDRSVLLAVYDYLHYLGCRFLLPKKEGEFVPSISRDKLVASYEKQASFYHRGVCIEGADSLENIMDYIRWLPKVGYNSFFFQFKSPYAFLSRWYSHAENPYAREEPYTPGKALEDLAVLEREAKKRGLMLHKAGHGWTGEVLGYQTVSWDPEETEEGVFTHRMAMINGKRALFCGIPANTNLCYHNADAIDAFAGLVVEYAKENPRTDYLHVWLADEYNNLCECEDCKKTTLSDQYVALLNEIDRRLTAEHLETRLVFLLYQELLWPPVKERLKNPKRFVLMFAPISRTFEMSYEFNVPKQELPDFVRNHVTLPTNLSENVGFLKGWQAIFDGDSFVYDYPLGRAHYGDFGYVHIAKVIHSDIQKLQQMGLNGYVSCQELRAAFPNALPNYIMGYTLFEKECSAEELIEEYFTACYGDASRQVLAYLTKLSSLSSCDYINGIGPRRNRDMVRRMEDMVSCCEAFSVELMQHRRKDGSWENIFWEVLEYHRTYVILFAKALRFLAMDDARHANQRWEALRDYICENEPKYQPFLDVYRILEVTKKYTGFYRT